jgi:hypothetical protein
MDRRLENTPPLGIDHATAAHSVTKSPTVTNNGENPHEKPAPQIDDF